MTAFLKAWNFQQQQLVNEQDDPQHDYKYRRPNILLVGVEEQCPDHLLEFFIHRQAISCSLVPLGISPMCRSKVHASSTNN